MIEARVRLAWLLRPSVSIKLPRWYYGGKPLDIMMTLQRFRESSGEMRFSFSDDVALTVRGEDLRARLVRSPESRSEIFYTTEIVRVRNGTISGQYDHDGRGESYDFGPGSVKFMCNGLLL